MIGSITFPEEPLDSRDRGLILTMFEEGSKGVGFNELVERARGVASRSTVALRVERLVRLGYLERGSGAGTRPGKRKPIRLTYKCYTFMVTARRAREVAAGLEAELASMRAREVLEEGEVKRWWGEFRGRYNGLFGVVGSLAMFYGTAAAGDLFLPLVVDDYKSLASKFMNLCRERPELLKAITRIIDEQASSEGVDMEKVRNEMRELLNPAVYRFREWGEVSTHYDARDRIATRPSSEKVPFGT